MNVTLYAAFSVPSGSGDEVEMTSSAGLMVSVKSFDPDWLALSCTVTVNENVPVAVGVPDRTPLVESTLKPGGSVPADRNHVIYGGVPPVAAKVWLYDVPMVPAGNGVAVVITGGGGSTVSE